MERRLNIDRLDNEAWLKELPCYNCTFKDFCRYANVLKKLDYPKDVFNINIECSIKNEHGG